MAHFADEGAGPSRGLAQRHRSGVALAAVGGGGGSSLTVLRHLQDVADQRAVAVEGLGPRQVDGPSLRGTESRHWVLRGMRQLPGGDRCGGAPP